MLRALAALLTLASLASCSARDGASLASDSRGSGEPRASSQGGASIAPATVEQLLATVREPGSRAVLVNVWATWCVPCREEFPDLMSLHRAYRERGLRLILVSADFDDQLPEARRFLARHGVDFHTYLKVGDDMKFINGLCPRWTGALPATFIYDGRGELQYFREGKASRAALEEQVQRLLDPQAHPPSKEGQS